MNNPNDQEAIAIKIPLLNPNEHEAQLVALHVREGQQISQGDLLCTLETTKSVHELESEYSGYIIGLQFKTGDSVSFGDILCYIASSPEWVPPQATTPLKAQKEHKIPLADTPPDSLRITQPAWELVLQHNINPEELPEEILITEKYLHEFIQNRQLVEDAASNQIFDPTAVFIYGGGGHGKSLIDLIRALGSYRIVGIIDDGLPRGRKIMGIPILGGVEKLPELKSKGVWLAVNAVGGIGNITTRLRVFETLKRAGFSCPTLIHPTAYVEPSAQIEAGVQVFPHAYIGSQAHIGFGSIVNTGAIVSHDCVLGEYVNISPGAILAGEVQIADQVLIGMGVTINLRVKVGQAARVGNSATVKEDVPERQIVRAGTIWKD